MFRVGVGCRLLVLALLLGVINFPLVWGFILVFSIAIALGKLHRTKNSGDTGRARPRAGMDTAYPMVFWRSVALSVLFLFFGAALNTQLTNLFPVSSLEVRPSYESTLAVGHCFSRRFLNKTAVGAGPNSFGEQWLLRKPTEVNQSAFWNIDFNVGFSTLMTALRSVGFLGLIAWLVPLLLVFAGHRAVDPALCVWERGQGGCRWRLLLEACFFFQHWCSMYQAKTCTSRVCTLGRDLRFSLAARAGG